MLGSRRPAVGGLLGSGGAIFGHGPVEFFQNRRVWAVGQSFDLADGAENGGRVAAAAVGDEYFWMPGG